jgi:hypothetical protein
MKKVCVIGAVWIFTVKPCRQTAIVRNYVALKGFGTVKKSKRLV